MYEPIEGNTGITIFMPTSKCSLPVAGSRFPPTFDRSSSVVKWSLTLKWPRYFYSRWFHGTPLKKTTFPPEFCNEICTIYVRAIKNHNSAKYFENVVPFQNGGQITDFYFASFRFWPKFEKPLSQRNFSMKFGSK